MEEPREGNVLQFLIRLAAESMPRGADHDDVLPWGLGPPLGLPDASGATGLGVGGGWSSPADVSGLCISVPGHPAGEPSSGT